MTRARIGRKIPPGFSLDVDFQLGPGVTALFGPADSGKTLILHTWAGFVRPNFGRLLLDDAILFDAAARVHVSPRDRKCGYVFQNDALFPHMTLRENLIFAARKWPRLERHRRAAEMLDRFQLAEAGGVWPREANAGQKLRCAVARALIAEPKLLLIDDCGIGQPLLDQIREVFPAPILLATRNIELCFAAGELLVLMAGRIVQRGAPRAVLDQPESVEVARLMGIPNLFAGAIAALDPGRNTSRLEFEHFALSAPYIPGHFRGDRIWAAIAAEDLRVHAGDMDTQANFVALPLIRVSERLRGVRLEFGFGVFADVSRERFARQKDNRSWQVEFPPEALRVL